MKVKTVTVIVGGTLMVIPVALLGKFIGAGVGTVLGAVCAYTLTDDIYRTLAIKWKERKARRAQEAVVEETIDRLTAEYNTRNAEARARAIH